MPCIGQYNICIQGPHWVYTLGCSPVFETNVGPSVRVREVLPRTDNFKTLSVRLAENFWVSLNSVIPLIHVILRNPAVALFP